MKILLPLKKYGLFAWLDGRTVQLILLERYALYENHFALKMAKLPLINRISSVLTVIWEISWILLPFMANPCYALFFMGSGVVFHVFNYVFLGINFIPFWMPAYVCFYPDIIEIFQIEIEFKEMSHLG